MNTEKRIVITGASAGIGKKVSEIMGSLGAKIYLGARRFEDFRSGNLHQLNLDLNNPQNVKSFAEKILEEGDIDILIHCAGLGIFKSFESSSLEDWDQTFNLNARGSFLIFKEFLASLQKSQGQIICVTSDVSSRPISGGAIYTASKYAQKGLLQCLQKEAHESGVRMTEICPGMVATGFGGEDSEASETVMDPGVVAETIRWVISMPKEVRIDSLLFHPAGQDVEY